MTTTSSNDYPHDESVRYPLLKAFCKNCYASYFFRNQTIDDVRNNRIDCGCGSKACPNTVYVMEERAS